MNNDQTKAGPLTKAYFPLFIEAVTGDGLPLNRGSSLTPAKASSPAFIPSSRELSLLPYYSFHISLRPRLKIF